MQLKDGSQPHSVTRRYHKVSFDTMFSVSNKMVGRILDNISWPFLLKLIVLDVKIEMVYWI